MRTVPTRLIERCRLNMAGAESPAGALYGAFGVVLAGQYLRILSGGVQDEYGWEHVSVSLADRCPTWGEMSWVKEQFWGEEECVLQFHPPRSKYVNHHEFTLHLWRQIGVPVELPPAVMV